MLLETTVKQIEDAFKEFTARDDIAIVLISQYVSIFNIYNYVNFLIFYNENLLHVDKITKELFLKDWRQLKLSINIICYMWNIILTYLSINFIVQEYILEHILF